MCLQQHAVGVQVIGFVTDYAEPTKSGNPYGEVEKLNFRTANSTMGLLEGCSQDGAGDSINDDSLATFVKMREPCIRLREAVTQTLLTFFRVTVSLEVTCELCVLTHVAE